MPRSMTSDSLNHLWHGDFTVFLEGIHHQTVAADVVNALLDKQKKGFDNNKPGSMNLWTPQISTTYDQ